MEKRGQVTIFIIVAVLIVTGVILFLIYRDNYFNYQGVNPQVAPVYDFVTSCLENTGENALVDVGENGGYVFTDDESFVGNAPYYLIDGTEQIPSVDIVESQISFIVNQELSYCILNFKDFKDQYENITSRLDNVETIIEDERVELKLTYPISVTKSQTSYEIKDFSSEIKLRITDYLKISEEIVSEQHNNNEICISCLYELGEEYGVNIELIDYGDSTIFTITDENYKLNDESYEWRFAIK